MIQTVTSPARMRGEIAVPGDKSISHRSLLFNAMARGTARVEGLLRAGDVFSTMRCLRALGVRIGDTAWGTVTVEGRAGRGFAAPAEVLDAGNSGTTMRLISGLLAAQPFASVITGDDSLRRRPMRRIIEPLRSMGASIVGAAGSNTGADGDAHAPLTIRGGALHGIRYRMPVASAQVKSCLMIAALYAEGATVIEEPAATRDHTERMFRAMGARVRVDGKHVSVEPGELRAVDVRVPGDISSAAFWLVAAAIHPDADLTVRNVGVNPSRTGILDALRAMGASVEVMALPDAGGEPVADLRVRSSRLRGTVIRGDLIPRLIDELPLLAVAGACASGVTEIRDAQELRAKESDRIQTTAGELRKLGATVEELPDGMIVQGGTGQGGTALRGAACVSHGDHRIAMAMAIAAMRAQGETAIHDAEAVDISYPQFWDTLQRIAVAR
ncbi:MAG: 3-phosphoshikimate 1-carboxyvinyltransferase [Dehalococcoidia bacterium]|nr:3-phosphoshikimate 1-carboxyvinyltransferase [Dehalococcoidia bacterium]